MLQVFSHGPGVDHRRIDPAKLSDLFCAFRSQQALVRRGAKHPAAKLAKINPGGQLLKKLATGVVTFRIQHPVKIALADPVIHTGFQVDDHMSVAGTAQLADAAFRQRAAGIGPRSADLTDGTAVLSAHGRKTAQKHRHRIVQNHDLLPGNAAPFQLLQERCAN